MICLHFWRERADLWFHSTTEEDRITYWRSMKLHSVGGKKSCGKCDGSGSIQSKDDKRMFYYCDCAKELADLLEPPLRCEDQIYNGIILGCCKLCWDKKSTDEKLNHVLAQAKKYNWPQEKVNRDDVLDGIRREKEMR